MMSWSFQVAKDQKRSGLIERLMAQYNGMSAKGWVNSEFFMAG